MLSFEWLSWLGDTVKLIGDLIPRRILIEPSEVGIKFKGMTKTVILNPGRHWIWPFFTKVRIEPAVKQTLYLGFQTLLTKDGTIVRFESSILFTVEDFITASTKFHCYGTQIDDDAKSVICKYINELDYETDIVGKLVNLNKHLTFRVRKKLKEYGVRVHRVQMITLTTGIPVMHIGEK